MNEKFFFKTRVYFTLIVTIAIWSLLGWNHYHGGVPSHSILARKDFPEISNCWGGLLLPLLTWFLLYRIEKRLTNNKEKPKSAINALYGFIGALFFGIFLSIFFTLGYMDIPGNMISGLFVLGLFFPIYRAECLLGFVIGMTFTFGAVLPSGFGLILVLIGVILYQLVRRGILYLVSNLCVLLKT